MKNNRLTNQAVSLTYDPAGDGPPQSKREPDYTMERSKRWLGHHKVEFPADQGENKFDEGWEEHATKPQD